jgi:hypothetical protein
MFALASHDHSLPRGPSATSFSSST